MTEEERAEQEEDFYAWVDYMEPALEEFFHSLPESVSSRLDYTVESLDVLEAWLLERYEDPDAALRKSETLLLDGAARYIGETFLKHLGGRWWIDPVQDPACIPMVTGFRSDLSAFPPITLATTATDRRTGHLISGNLCRRLAFLSGDAERSPLLDIPAFRKHTKVTTEERLFQIWLDMMPRGVNELLLAMPESVAGKLDLSAESLGVLEAWLLERYPSSEAARACDQVVTLDGVARYIGETFRDTLGGTWWFDLEGWSHNGLPQLIDLAGSREPLCPLALAREAIERRTGTVLADRWNDYAEPWSGAPPRAKA